MVVGTGPAGIFAALTLAANGVAVRVLERGLYCVCTPFAVGTHHEGASRGRRANEPAEDVLWERHPEWIARDPYASPHRSLVRGG